MSYSSPDRSSFGRVGLIAPGPLEQLDDIAVRIEDEELVDAVTARHGAGRRRNAVRAQPSLPGRQVVDLEREVRGEPARETGPRRQHPGSTGRIGLHEQVDLGVAEREPRACEGEARRTRQLLEAERLTVRTAATARGPRRRGRSAEGVWSSVYRTAAVGSVSANRKELSLPVIEVKLYDRRVTEESVPKMIEALTNALHESSGAAKEHIHVIIQGIAPSHWGQGGKPST